MIKRIVLYSLCAAAILGSASLAHALELTKVKAAFLANDYKLAITEGERAMEEASDAPNVDELYYLLGVSYFKDGNYLRASDIFEIILNEYKGSRFTEDAILGLADANYMRGDIEDARQRYLELLKTPVDGLNMDTIYYRLSLLEAKAGETKASKMYRDKIKDPAVYAPGTLQEMSTCPLFGGYYTIQVGSYSNRENALKMQKELQKKGLQSFVDPGVIIDNSGAEFHRVKVGRYSTRLDAEDAAKRLAEQGYPVKICP